jgi:hypothetical protein
VTIEQPESIWSDLARFQALVTEASAARRRRLPAYWFWHVGDGVWQEPRAERVWPGDEVRSPWLC